MLRAFGVIVLLTAGLWTTTALGQETTSDLRPALDSALSSYSDNELQRLSYDLDARARVARQAVLSYRLEKRASDVGVLNAPDVKRALNAARSKVIGDALREWHRKEYPIPESDLKRLARDLYDAYPDAYTIPRKIKIAYISLHEDSSKYPDPEATLKEISLAMYSQSDFARLAKEYSEAPNAVDGGLVKKWLIEPETGSRASEFFKRAFAMTRVGELSPPFEWNHGWHLVMLADQTPAKLVPFPDAEPAIVSELEQDLQALAFARYVKALESYDKAEADSILKELMDQGRAKQDESD